MSMINVEYKKYLSTFCFKSIGQASWYQSLTISNLLLKQCLNNFTLIFREKTFLLETLKSSEFCCHNGTRKYTCNIQQPKGSLDIWHTYTSILLQQCLKQSNSDAGFSDSCVQWVAFSLVIQAARVPQFVCVTVYLQLSEVHYLAKI